MRDVHAHSLEVLEIDEPVCHNVTLGRRDFYRRVCLALGLSPKATADAVFYAISTHLHILANYEWDSKPLLSIVLVGLPELRQRLPLAKNRSLWSRTHTRISLGEATAGDTAEYIGHRLKRAGCEREALNSDALALVHEQAQGRLREIDRICTDALRLAARRKLRVVDRELVARVLGDGDENHDD